MILSQTSCLFRRYDLNLRRQPWNHSRLELALPCCRRIVVAPRSIHSLALLLALGSLTVQKRSTGAFLLVRPTTLAPCGAGELSDHKIKTITKNRKSRIDQGLFGFFWSDVTSSATPIRPELAAHNRGTPKARQARFGEPPTTPLCFAKGVVSTAKFKTCIKTKIKPSG